MEKLTDLIKNHPENPVNPVKKKKPGWGSNLDYFIKKRHMRESAWAGGQTLIISLRKDICAKVLDVHK